MMPSTNTKQDTTVLMYLKVSLISMFLWHGGAEGGRGGPPGVFPPLGTCAGAEDCGRLELKLLGQEVLVGGVIVFPVSRSFGVAQAGGSPPSSPQTLAEMQARSSATRASPHRLGGGCMLLLAPMGARWLLRCFLFGDRQGNQDGTLGSATEPRL